jgi:hypothetical protein
MATEVTAEEADEAGNPTCLDLLIDEISGAGWKFNLAKEKSFYIRRVTWFRENVLSAVTKLAAFLDKPDLPNGGGKGPSAFEIFEAQFREANPDWFVSGFEWDRPFSARQAIDALSMRTRKPLSFEKAAKSIVLCACAAQALKEEGKTSVTVEQVLSTMKIEPAVFYIQDFTTNLFRELKKNPAYVGNTLRSETAQVHLIVFDQMANGYTVTRTLAEAVREHLLRIDPTLQIGAVDSTYSAKSKGAATEEELRD